MVDESQGLYLALSDSVGKTSVVSMSGVYVVACIISCSCSILDVVCILGIQVVIISCCL